MSIGRRVNVPRVPYQYYSLCAVNMQNVTTCTLGRISRHHITVLDFLALEFLVRVGRDTTRYTNIGEKQFQVRALLRCFVQV